MTASIVAAPTKDGRTRCTTLRSAPPISLRDTADGLYLVASGAGPVGGDHLQLAVDVRAGASLAVRSAAASMVLPGPTAAPSSLTVRASVAGALEWLPEPTVAIAGCDHLAATHISLADGGRLVWREEIVLGRHDEASGSLLQRIHVDRGGSPLLRTEVPLGPRWPSSDGPAGTAGSTAVGSLLVVGVAPPPGLDVAHAAVLSIASDAWLFTAIADDAAALRGVLDAALATVGRSAGASADRPQSSVAR